MMKKISFILIIMFFSTLQIFSNGQSEEDISFLQDGIEKYNNGNLEEAAESFAEAAKMADKKTSSMAYFNKGIVDAELAQKNQDTEQKRKLLEDSYQALKRSVEIGSLSAHQKMQASQSMEIVREEITKLPPKQNDEKGNGDSDDKQDGSPDNSQDNENSQGGNSSKEDMLKKQQELSEQTANGGGSSEDLSKEQRSLQEESEQAGMKQAAENQKRAADALEEGDREKASEFQRAAEEAIAETIKKENTINENQSQKKEDDEAENILNQEADRESVQNRLDKLGGIIDADKNW